MCSVIQSNVFSIAKMFYCLCFVVNCYWLNGRLEENQYFIIASSCEIKLDSYNNVNNYLIYISQYLTDLQFMVVRRKLLHLISYLFCHAN